MHIMATLPRLMDRNAKEINKTASFEETEKYFVKAIQEPLHQAAQAGEADMTF